MLAAVASLPTRPPPPARANHPVSSRQRDKDAALVQRMARGDRGPALEEFYARYAGLAMALLLRILGSRAEAEELLQELFVELWRRAPQYDPARASVGTWVTTIARSRGLDALRARRRRFRDQEVPSDDVSVPAPADQRPDEQVSQSQRSEAVRAALADLSPDQRQVVEYSYFRGLSHTEIANELGIPVGTVKSRILAAMKLLREAMQKVGEAES